MNISTVIFGLLLSKTLSCRLFGFSYTLWGRNSHYCLFCYLQRRLYLMEWQLSDASHTRILVGGFLITVAVGPSMLFSSNLPFVSSKSFMMTPFHVDWSPLTLNLSKPQFFHSHRTRSRWWLKIFLQRLGCMFCLMFESKVAKIKIFLDLLIGTILSRWSITWCILLLLPILFHKIRDFYDCWTVFLLD